MPEKTKHRIVVDTNLWISFLLTDSFPKIDKLFEDNKVTLIFSQELLDEFLEVSQRPKFRKYFSLNDVETLLRRLRLIAEFIDVTSTVDICRDPEDNFLLALAQDGNATHLLTGDKYLLILKKIGKTKILTVAEYGTGR